MGEREAEGGDSVVATRGIKQVVVKHRDFNHVRGAGEKHRHREQLVEGGAATLDDPRPDPRALRKADGNVCVYPRRKPLFSIYVVYI